VNLKEQLVSSLKEIDRLRGNNKKNKEKLQIYEKKDDDIDEKEKNSYHLEDSTKRGKNEKISGDNPIEGEGRLKS
jgi:hypothetical protein